MSMERINSNQECLHQASHLNYVGVEQVATGELWLALKSFENALKMVMQLSCLVPTSDQEVDGSASGETTDMSLISVPLLSSQSLSQDQQDEDGYFNHALLLKYNCNTPLSSSQKMGVYLCFSSVILFNLAQTFQLRGTMTGNARILSKAISLYNKVQDLILTSQLDPQSACFRCCMAVLIVIFTNKSYVLEQLGLYDEAQVCFGDLLEMMRYSNERPPAFNDRCLVYFQLSRMCQTIPKHSPAA